MIKPTLWDGRDLKGTWLVTRKLDGVRMLRDAEGNPVSRAGHQLNNLELIPPFITDAEIFVDDWETTVGIVRSYKSEPLEYTHAYSLAPLDQRLHLGSLKDPTADAINEWLRIALARGDEGLVLYKGRKALKVKPKETYDVPVTGATEGKGKYAGLIGALITPMGKVSGMTDSQRIAFTEQLPAVIEVECMELTRNGKFRHPRFLRERFDKAIPHS